MHGLRTKAAAFWGQMTRPLYGFQITRKDQWMARISTDAFPMMRFDFLESQGRDWTTELKIERLLRNWIAKRRRTTRLSRTDERWEKTRRCWQGQGKVSVLSGAVASIGRWSIPTVSIS